jgi:predicted unusual protein kinase regulating ubiquinone biosynthesis (AarF/ABC1/UbiB family)
LACKIQYPAMEETIKTDLTQINILTKIYHMFKGNLKTQELQKELEDRLYEEIDYIQEARHITWFRHIFKGHSKIVIPEVYPKLSGKKVLTMSWLEGFSLKDLENTPEKYTHIDRRQLGRTLFQGFYDPLYAWGILHGDPHPGNFQFTHQGHVQLLDFGCVRVFCQDFLEGIFNLYNGLLEENIEQQMDGYEGLGFRFLTYEMMETLNHWARFLFDPLLEDRVRPISDDPTGQRGRQIMAKVHQDLVVRGSLTPPKEFLLIDRVAVGLGSALLSLGSQENWHRLFQNYKENFSKENIGINQAILEKKIF